MRIALCQFLLVATTLANLPNAGVPVSVAVSRQARAGGLGGRLTKVIRSDDSSTYHTVVYAYCDTSSPLRIIGKERTVSHGADIAVIRFYSGWPT